MEITKEMIEAYKVRFPDVSDEAAEGSLAMWAKGEGELDAELVNGNEVLAPIAEAYFAAKGQEVPESVEAPLVEVEEEKLPEPESTNT